MRQKMRRLREFLQERMRKRVCQLIGTCLENLDKVLYNERKHQQLYNWIIEIRSLFDLKSAFLISNRSRVQETVFFLKISFGICSQTVWIHFTRSTSPISAPANNV